MPAKSEKQRDAAIAELRRRDLGLPRDKFPRMDDATLQHFTKLKFHCKDCA